MMTLARTAHYVTIVAVYDEIDLALPSATWGIAFVLWLHAIRPLRSRASREARRHGNGTAVFRRPAPAATQGFLGVPAATGFR